VSEVVPNHISNRVLLRKSSDSGMLRNEFFPLNSGEKYLVKPYSTAKENRCVSNILYFIIQDVDILHLSQFGPVSPGRQKQAYLPPGNDSQVDPKLQGSEEQAMSS
jgi:hypothetical protein